MGDIIRRYDISKILIMDNRKQFDARNFLDFCEGLNIVQRFASVTYPQTSGLTEVTNRIALQELKKRLERAKGNWTEELPSVLRFYRTTPWKSMGESLFPLSLE